MHLTKQGPVGKSFFKTHFDILPINHSTWNYLQVAQQIYLL